MRTVVEFPRDVLEWPNVFIPLADGTRLAARVWLPADAADDPVPAVLEYLPYRKRDGTVHRDALTHAYLAGHGYACVRVDMRGNGDSDGLMAGEYLPQEQDDALEVIAWLRAQPWCSGKVGMIGISWGGFNGLQVAYRRPEGLDAVVSLCSTDDRYADDIHFKGGCLLCEQLGWSSTMLAYSSRPADPAMVGETWRTQWLERLENEPHLAEIWMDHLTRDAFWRHGSICEDFGRIEAAVMLVGAWADSYHNPVPRMLEHLGCHRQAIIGPWVHKYPHFAVPGPQIGFLQEVVRFYDRFLKGVANGVEAAPALRAYLMDGLPPATSYEHRPGRWVAEPVWPSPNIESRSFGLSSGRLEPEQTGSGLASVCSPQTVGQAAGEYCPIWLGPELSGDQRIEDGGSLLFDGPVLTEGLTRAGRTGAGGHVQRGPATGEPRGAPVRCRAERGLGAGDLWRVQPLSPHGSRASRTPRTGTSLSGADRAGRCRLSLPGGPSAAPGDLDRLLAADLALAGERDGHASPRRVPAECADTPVGGG